MNTIPKTIHYCWFGNKEIPDHLKRYMETWKKVLPDYQFLLWNEKNFDIESTSFTKEAYKKQVWAFVSDYVRLYTLYNHGGIYLDTDVEMVQRFDHLLTNQAFCGFESRYHLGSAVIGSQKDSIWIKDLLSFYDNKHFINSDGTLDKIANTTFFTEITTNKYKLKLNNKLQCLNGVTVYPRDYFYPDNLYTRKLKLTPNSVTIHRWDKSWCDPKEPTYKDQVRALMYKTLGDDITEELYKNYWKLTKKLTNRKK